MNRIKYAILLIILSAVVAVVGFVVWQVAQPAAVVTSASATDPGLTPSTYRLVHTLESRTGQGSEQAAVFTQLGYAYLQSARETAEGVYVEHAERAFRRALDLDPDAFEAMNGMGLVASVNHQFGRALAWGQRSLDVHPHRSVTYGLIADAYVELGRYEEAVAAAQTMVDLRPDQASYSRVSYLREMHGDLEGAIEAMRRAVRAGSGSPENTAWCQVYLGHLYFHQGRLDAAEHAYNAALHLVPEYGHALAGKARILLAGGQIDDAVTAYERVVDVYSIPEYEIALGGAYTAAGRSAEAIAQFDEAVTTLEEERESGMDVDEELALLLLDTNQQSARALELAKGAYERRPTIKNASILAWALYANGRLDEAGPLAEESLRLGTRDPQFYYRAGRIAAAAKDNAAATMYLEDALSFNLHGVDREAALTAHATLTALR